MCSNVVLFQRLSFFKSKVPLSGGNNPFIFVCIFSGQEKVCRSCPCLKHQTICFHVCAMQLATHHAFVSNAVADHTICLGDTARRSSTSCSHPSFSRSDCKAGESHQRIVHFDTSAVPTSSHSLLEGIGPTW